MPFLAGGHALSLPAKIAITNASFLLMSAELIEEEEGWADNWEDTMAILQFAGTVYVLWVPPSMQAAIAARVGALLAPLAVPAAIVTSTIIVGGVVSYFVDPDEGLENYKDFLTQWKKIPGRTVGAIETISKKKVEPALGRAQVFGRFIWGMAERQFERTGFSQHHPYVI